MSDGDLHTEQARWLVSALADAGARDVVLSPGSRSTPLALAVAREPRVRLHVHIDERVAAFFALGIARVTRVPPVLVCTSGTAGAHWLPAAIEAAQSYLPLLLLTADRPWDAYDCHAPQTIDQVDLFGRYARHRAEVGLPDEGGLAAVGRVAAQCVHLAVSPTPGPVHLNARYRKPLEPVSTAKDEPWRAALDARRERGATRAFAPAVSPSKEAVGALSEAIASASRVVFACGPSIGRAPRGEVEALAARVGAVLLAETTSGRRHGDHRGATLCAGFEVALRSPSFRARVEPELVVCWGLPPTATSFAVYGGRAPRWVVSPHGWPDPAGDATALVVGECDDVARAVSSRVSARGGGAWLAEWERANAVVEVAARESADGDALTEASTARVVSEVLGDGATLALGNSMPVRDIDTFAPATERRWTVLHQRGASGIDGLIAGAAGARAASDGPVLVVVVDVSMAHDVGGLNALRGAGGGAVALVVQNGGGRIFAELPLGKMAREDAEVGAVFERCFLTPQGVELAGAAGAYGVEYARVETVTALRDALTRGLSSERPAVIEAVGPAEDGTARRAALRERVIEGLG